jgi:predicted metal-dependent phosphoesterase TrpH
LAKKKKYRFEIIVGEEVSAKEGHILGLFLDKKVAPNLTAAETIKRIKEQGGIAIPAHPFYHSRLNDGKKQLADGVGAITLLQEREHFDGIETVNATPTLGTENLRAKYINRSTIFKAEVGCSDAHIVDAIGKGYTLFEGRTAEDLREAILDNQTQAMNDRWDILGLGRYAYFFWPRELRIAINTLLFGPRKKRPEIINFPSTKELKRRIKN